MDQGAAQSIESCPVHVSTPTVASGATALGPPAPRRVPLGRRDALSFAVIGVLALATRMVGLGARTDHGTPIFDEKHYAPQAWDMTQSIINPLLGGIELNPGYGLVVHPPLGKRLIALGEMIFGYGPWGWRIMAALFGTAVVLAAMGLTRSLTQSVQAGVCAGILGLFDGVLLVSSRYGMLDIFQTFFVVAAAWALVLDHQQMRRRMHAAWERGLAPGSPLGPRLGFRWWRFSAGLLLGMALAVKWSGLYYIAFFGLASVLSDAWLRSRYRARRPIRGALARDTIPALASLVLVPALYYLWSWRTWFASETSIYRHAATDGTIEDGSLLSRLPDTMASWLHYHLSVLEFHSSLTTSGGHVHPWDSKPLTWLVAGRPILYYSRTGIDCGAGTCRAMIYLFGTPIIWWLTVPVLLWGLYRAFARRDRTVIAPLVGFAAGFVPWLIAYDRQMYFFYATPLIPFTVTLLALALWRITARGRLGASIAGGYLGAVIVFFLYFSPLFYGFLIPEWYYRQMMWLPSWT